LGDIGRVQRQQEVLKALATKVLSPDTLSRLPEIFEVIKRNVDTDLSLTDLLSLARFGLTLDRDRDLQLVMLPGRFSSPGEFSSSFWVPDTEKIQVLCARYLGIGEVADIPSKDLSQVRVAVQNATGEKLNRRQLLRYLRSKGFVTIDLLRDYPDPLWHSEIIPQQGDIPLAEAAQKALGVGDIRRDSTGQINSDITLRLGKDWAVGEGKSLQPTNVSP
jgi:hypothetical protein